MGHLIAMNKESIFLIIIFFYSFPALAQEEPGENIRDPRAREKIRAAHAAYITGRLELTSSEAEKFWPVYREYSEKRRALRQELRDEKIKGADEQKLLDLDLKIKQQELDLEKDYSQRLRKIISAEKLLKLRQAEGDFRKLLLRQIQQRHRRRR
jgi:hypothetical protein